MSVRDTLLPFLAGLSFMLAACTDALEEAQQEAATARALYAAGNLPAARSAIGRAMSHRDDQLDIILLDARIKYAMGDVRPAYDAYRTVLVFDSDNMEALPIVAQLAIGLNELRVARDAIKKALEIDPRRGDVIMSQAILHLNLREFDEAIVTADRLLETSPNDPRGIAIKARALSQQGKRAQAFALLDETIGEIGNQELLSITLLEIARSEGRVPTMLEQFAFLVPRNPESTELALDEINTLYKSGTVDRARLRSASFIDRFGQDPDAMHQLVELWEEYDENPTLDSAANRLARSDMAPARMAVARFYLRRGKVDRAEDFVKHAPDSRYMGLIARLHVARGSDEGPRLARQILQSDTTNCDALSALVRSELAARDNRKAIVNAQLLATQCNDRLDGYLGLVEAYAKDDRTASVERVYREGIEVHPQNPELSEAFANWLVSRGRNRAAVSAMRRLGNAAPSRISTWEAYARVCETIGDSVCRKDAAAGLAKAKDVYVLDPLPGTRPRDPIFGRSWS